MSAPVRLVLFGLLAAVVFVSGAALGGAFGPSPGNESGGHNEHEEPAMTHYRIDGATKTVEPQPVQTLQFRIVDGRGVVGRSGMRVRSGHAGCPRRSSRAFRRRRARNRRDSTVPRDMSRTSAISS